MSMISKLWKKKKMNARIREELTAQLPKVKEVAFRYCREDLNMDFENATRWSNIVVAILEKYIEQVF